MNSHDRFEDGADGDDMGTTPPSDDVRAGEYALGVLDAGERRRAESRIAAEPEFAALVDAWDRRLAPWLLRADEVPPSAHVWPRVRSGIGWSPVEGGRRGVWNSVSFWRAATGLAAAAGIAAVVIGLQPPTAVAPSPPVAVVPPPVAEEQVAKPVTVLARDDGSTGWLASIDVDAGKVLMVPVPTPADASGMVNELWIIPAGAAPVSLGFVSNEKAHTITVPAALQQELAVGATLAITLEPQAGMPHAAPSGPVVAKGNIRTI